MSLSVVRSLSIENYRSIRRLALDLSPLTVVTGANGVGKSNLYKSLELLRAAATGDLSLRLAREGGMASALFAGLPWTEETTREKVARSGGSRIKLSARIEDLEYALELGAPRPSDAALGLDPVVKEEKLRSHAGKRPVVMAERKGPSLSARNDSGRLETVTRDLWLFETALSSVAEPSKHPELDRARRLLSAMRFYHQFRADPGSPLRRPPPSIMTPSVSSDGEDWAAALASLMTIEDRGFEDSLAAKAIAAAFPGGRVEPVRDGWPISLAEISDTVDIGLFTTEFRRPFSARELSDGTLRFLVLTAALTALRPPPFMALNEPESSLHPSLITPLGDLIGAAAERGQILVVTHSEALAEHLSVEFGAQLIRLVKDRGETRED